MPSSPRRASSFFAQQATATASHLPRRTSSFRNKDTTTASTTPSRGRRSSVAALTASARAKIKQQPDTNDKRAASKRASATITTTTTTTSAARNHAEPNSAKDRRLLAQLLAADLADDSSKRDDDGDMWRELLNIKGRLERLEVKNDDDDVLSSSSATSSTTTTLRTPTSLPGQMQLPQRTTVHQRRLEEAFRHFEQQQPPMSPLTRAMANVVAETISMNQRLWAAIPRDLDARSLVALQKSSDHQLKELTVSLQQMSSAMLPAPASQPVSPPSSLYCASHHYHSHTACNNTAPRQHAAVASSASYHGSASPAVRPTKVAGILDYHDYLASPPTSSSITTRSSRYLEPRYTSSNLLYSG